MWWILCLALVLGGGGPVWAEPLRLCDQLLMTWDTPEEEEAVRALSFTESEKQYLCGRQENPSWDDIPLAQARGFLIPFLESRGYHQPVIDVKEDALWVRLGPRANLQSIVVQNAPDGFDIGRARGFPGRVMTPGLLNDIETWSRKALRHAGYPCAQVSSRANPGAGRVIVDVKPGARRVIGPITRNALPGEEGLATEAAGRWQIFKAGDAFDGQELELSERRPRALGLLLNTFYLYDCDGSDGPLALRQQSALGTPRLLTFGVGVNTEGLLVTKAGFHNRRLDRRGSAFVASLQASRRVQEFESTYQWYWSAPSRWHWRPRLLVRHADERHYETTTLKISAGPAYSFDARTILWSFEFGPAWEMTRTYRGQGEPETRSLLVEASLAAQSHGHEFYRSSPRSGFETALHLIAADEEYQAAYTATKISWSGQALWNVAAFDPPLAVMGLRWRWSETATDDDSLADLPSPMLHYLGGSTDIRGFDRQELPLQGTPQRRAGYLGWEVRHAPAPYPEWQPFVFVDAGKFGRQRFGFDAPTYWSPGAGVRWESLFGVFRMTLAKGMIASAGDLDAEQVDRHTHWQFYFSFGEEF